MPSEAAKKRKHVEIFAYFERASVSDEHHAGDRISSEHGLVEIFNTSRPTVARALRDLQQAGLVARRAGSGTFVRRRGSSSSGRELGTRRGRAHVLRRRLITVTKR